MGNVGRHTFIYADNDREMLVGTLLFGQMIIKDISVSICIDYD